MGNRKGKLLHKVERQTSTEVSVHVFDEGFGYGIRVFAHKDRAGNTLFNVQETNGASGAPTKLFVTKLIGEKVEIPDARKAD